MKCAICKDTLDVESPVVIRGYNPITFCMAWMHLYCYRDAYDGIGEKPAKKAQYRNRQEEYLYECGV